MQRIRSLVLLLATFGSVVVLVSAPVAAQHGADSEGGDDDSSSQSTDTSDSHSSGSDDSDSSEMEANDQSDDSNSAELESTNETSHHGVKSELERLQEDAKDQLKLLRRGHRLLSKAERKLVCERREDNINKRIGNFGDAAERHLNVFNSIFTKVQAFYTSKGLSVSDYDTLVATATAKQTLAQSAVDTLKNLDGTIDCSATDPAQTLETIKTAVANARTALQDYRASIKDLIVAIKAVLPTDDSEGSN